jgi:hypothetical protein
MNYSLCQINLRIDEASFQTRGLTDIQPRSRKFSEVGNNQAKMSIKTPWIELFGIKHPILLVGMNQASGADLAAAVSRVD